MQDLPTFFQSFPINQRSFCRLFSPRQDFLSFSFYLIFALHFLNFRYGWSWLLPGYWLPISWLFSFRLHNFIYLITHFIHPFHFLRETLELWYFRLNVLTYSHLQRNSKVSKFHPSHPFYPFSIAASRHSLLLFGSFLVILD